MAAKQRKPGQWREIAAGRARVEKVFRTGRGLTNIPDVLQPGSANYQRLMKRQQRNARAT